MKTKLPMHSHNRLSEDWVNPVLRWTPKQAKHSPLVFAIAKEVTQTQTPLALAIRGVTQLQVVLAVLGSRGERQSQVLVAALHVKLVRQAQAGVSGAGVTVSPVAELSKLHLRQLESGRGNEMVESQVHAVLEAIFNGS